MARPNMPTIPDHKLNFYREQLYRELSHMFKWEGLPSSIPVDYLERNLIRHGRVMMFEDEEIGLDILRAEVIGFNRHGKPVQARSNVDSTHELIQVIERKVKRLTDSENVEFNPLEDCVLISNMYNGESCKDIVDHFAERLAIVQLAFDTNLMWQNRPFIFPVENQDTKLSIEKLFADIFSGKPFTIVDKNLVMFNQNGEVGIKLDVPFIADKLLDIRNELMMKFRETVGIDTAGVDKAERVLTGEIEANEQHTMTVLQIMLEQRQIACENINAFFGLNVSVGIHKPKKKEGEDYGTGDGGTTTFTGD